MSNAIAFQPPCDGEAGFRAAPVNEYGAAGAPSLRRVEARADGEAPKPARAYGRSAGPSPEVIVGRLRKFLAAHLDHRLDMAELAAAIGVSESTARRAVQAQTGERLARFVVNTRLDQARAWLLTNREARTQAEIAAALGFSSPEVFARAYARRFGEPMSLTRRRAVVEGGSDSEY
ncbi:MAG: helix-turn-helix transcriptional regulator [Caulobacteraceae bacterium]|nr:helix-turn-helix transcriptional regulator [Caulobacteraceae bacterium]